MALRNRRIVFVVSTSGHVRGMVELAKRLQRWRADTAILNIPSDLKPNLDGQDGSSFIDEYVWCGNGVLGRTELEALKKQVRGTPTKFWVRIDFLSRWAIATFGRGASTFFLYLAMMLGVFKYTATRLTCRKRQAASPGFSGFLRGLFLEAFRLLCTLRHFLPSPENRRFGGLVLLASQSNFFFGLWKSQLELEYLSRFFAGYRPDLIVLPEQNCGYGHEVLITWARQAGVPILVMPYTMAGRQEWATSLSEWPECHVRGALRRLLAKGFPEWTYDYKGSRLILPLPWLFSCESLGCPPAIPWVTNSGPDVVVAADNLFTEEFYRREGVDTADWVVVGSLAEDNLHRAMQERIAVRQRITGRLGLDPRRPLVIIGLPPDQFDMGMAGDVEFQNYRSLVEFLVGATTDVAGQDYNVVVNLHPRTRKDDVAYVESGLARIVDEPIEEILPAAHLYISVASATIRWAVACGVPVINFDAYCYDYRDYRGLEGVVDVKTRKEFGRQVAAVVRDEVFRERLGRAQAADAERLFRIDGKAEERIAGLMAELCDRTSGRA